jgi:hypothetical protein
MDTVLKGGDRLLETLSDECNDLHVGMGGVLMNEDTQNLIRGLASVLYHVPLSKKCSCAPSILC